MDDDNEDWLEEPADTPVPPEQDVDQQIDFDLHCVRCGYNLRAARASGNCPECGEPVETTLRPDLLHMANPAWLGKLRKGMNWLIAAIVMGLLMIPVFIIIGIAIEASNSPATTGTMPMPAILFMGAVSLVFSIVYIVAAWCITEPEPESPNQRVSRPLTRWTILPAMLLSVISLFFSVSNQSTAMTIGSAIDFVSTVLLAIGFLACLWYLRLLANRIPEPSLARQTIIVFWGSLATYAILIVVFIGIAIFALAMASSTSPNAAASAAGVMSLLLCPLLIAMLVFGIWWIVLMFRYRTRFTQAHQIALSQNDATRAPDETYLS